MKVRVLFVCMGNICRSPAAEGVFRRMVDEAGLGHEIELDSAGVIGYHAGERADARMRDAASRRGYALESIARQVRRQDFDDFDLVVAMDHDNLADLEALAGGPQPHIRLLGCFLGEGCGNPEAAPVPDPYYGGPQGFETVLDMLEEAGANILAHCRSLREAGGGAGAS